jgi:hypothetical protein
MSRHSKHLPGADGLPLLEINDEQERYCRQTIHLGNLCAVRSRALAASSMQFFGSAFVSSELRKVLVTAAMLLDEGYYEAEVAQYFVKHMLLPEDRASSYVASLKHTMHGLHLALTDVSQIKFHLSQK